VWLNDPAARAAFATADEQLTRLARTDYAPAVVREIQREKLDGLWARAGDVPYYRELPGWEAHDLARLPVTPRERLKASPEAFARSGLTAARYYESTGSSGRPTPTPRLAEDIIHNVVGVAGLWRRALGDAPSRVASLLPSDVVPVGDFVAGVCEYLGHAVLRCYPFSRGICDWDRLETLFAGYRPDSVFAAPGVLLQWTRILKTRGRLHELREGVRTIMLLGEVSLPGQRRKLAADWGADVLDASYGSTETGTIAATCERGGLHLLLSGHVVELRTGDAVHPVAPGASGELVDTPLNNFARPLLRYGTGDVVDVPAEPCPCGLPLPTVRVHGRSADGVSLRGVPLSEHLVGSIVYDDPRLTGYLVQLRADGSRGRLVLEKDVDFGGADGDLVAGVAQRSARAGVEWDDVVVVAQLPPASKSGGSQKSWKRTNVVAIA
jgi:phenylacetate-coenzyme A ligase PaaK-like adenylate-forming protein